MRLESFEKLVLGLAVLAVFLVGVLVGFQAFFWSLNTGMQSEAADADQATIDWLNEVRQKNGKGPSNKGWVDIPVSAPKRVAKTKPGQKGPTKRTAPKAKPTPYFSKSDVPPSQRVPGIGADWIIKKEGYRYVRTRHISSKLHQRYRSSLKETLRTAKEGGGEFTKTSDGTDAYKVNWLRQAGQLANILKLKEGDLIISVNGYPVGTSPKSGMALYDQLRNEKRFAVEIERQGKRTILPYEVR